VISLRIIREKVWMRLSPVGNIKRVYRDIIAMKKRILLRWRSSGRESFTGVPI